MLIHEGFQQAVPKLEGTAWSDDTAFQAIVRRLVPPDIYRKIDDDLTALQNRIAGPIRELCLQASEPVLVQYDQWGRRVDELHTSEGWRGLKRIAAEEGLITIAAERRDSEYSRVWSFAKIALWNPHSASVSCPLAMTDGAYRTLELYGNEEMKQDIMPRLASQDPDKAWLGAQWMTERPGGSDVSLTETVARPCDPNKPIQNGDAFIVDGFKWFSSATDGDVTMALARTGTVESGARGLSLFAIKMRMPDGKLNGIHIHRLKKKWGTKTLPTAELSLNGAIGHLVGDVNEGVKTIASVLNITRVHSVMACTSSLGRALYLARAFAKVRKVGGAHGTLLSKNELHTAMLSESELVYRALMQLAFGTALLMGKDEVGKISQSERLRLRLLTPVIKAFCARLATRETLNLIESWGGQGYMQENEFGTLIQDSSVERIWEGTSNVLALDVARVLRQSKGAAVSALSEWASATISTASSGVLSSELKKLIVGDLLLLRDATQMFVNGQADPVLPRRLLFHIACIAAAIMLLEQAIWSSNSSMTEDSQVDAFTVRKWVTSGDSRTAAQDLQSSLASGDAGAHEDKTLTHRLVYGSKL